MGGRYVSKAFRIDSVAVLGAGTMGAQIAAHCANAGLPALLLDLDDKTAREGLKRAGALKPDPFFDAASLARITTGGFDTLLRGGLGNKANCAAGKPVLPIFVESHDLHGDVAC